MPAYASSVSGTIAVSRKERLSLPVSVPVAKVTSMRDHRRPPRIQPELVAVTVLFSFVCIAAACVTLFTEAAGRDIAAHLSVMTGVMTLVSGALALCVRK